MLGCGLPGGEQGYNMARVVAVLLGLDDVPGATITRYCSSSLQTTRMAMHAIKAGEADVFISAGVEMVSRFAKGSSDGLPDTQNPLFAERRGPHRQAPPRAARVWHDPREDGELPDVYIAMGQTAENVAAAARASPGRSRTSSASARRTSPRRPSPTASGSARSPRSTLPDGTVVAKDDGPRAGITLRGVSGLKPVFRPDGTSPPATAARSTTAPPRSSS